MVIVFVDYIDIPYHASSPYERALGGSQSAVCYLSVELVKLGNQVIILNHVDVIRVDEGVLCLPFSHIELLDMQSVDCLILVNECGNGHRFRSMVRNDAIVLYWVQQAHDQRDVFPLKDGVERCAFDAFVFVSNWQKEQFITHYSVPASSSYVRRNAMSPAFELLYTKSPPIARTGSTGGLVLAYISTPFRGLDLLAELFPEVKKRFPSITLRVYSDMKVYARDEYDDGEYVWIYENLKNLDGVEFIGTISQSKLAQELSTVDILAYPNTFAETSCIAVIEAMAAGCRIVTTSLGALPETTAGFATLVPMDETRQAYIDSYTETLCSLIEELVLTGGGQGDIKQRQVEFMHANYTWRERAPEWDLMLKELFFKRTEVFGGQKAQLPDSVKIVENVLQHLRVVAENAYMVGDYQAARHSLETILALDDTDAIAYNYLGIINASLGNPESAIACFEKSLELSPGFVDVLFNLGNAFKQVGRLDQAEKYYFKAGESDGSMGDVHNNLGTLYQKEFMLDDSIACFNRALELDPGNPYYLNNLALSEYHLKHFDEATSLLEKALVIKQDYHEARRNLGIIQLHQGFFKDGWQNYDSRVPSLGLHPDVVGKIRHLPASETHKISVLVISEQGAGDTLHFCRYLAYLNKNESNVTVVVPSDLLELLKVSFPEIADVFVSDQVEIDISAFDEVVPLLSLSRYLHVDSLKSEVKTPYLVPDPDKFEFYRSVFFDHDRLKVGIFWQGNRMHLLDKLRSISLSSFELLFNVQGVTLYSFQKGYGSEQMELVDGHEIVDLGCLFDDFSETAAALMNIDLLITVDSAIAHLSAALGKRTWILLSRIADWRWGEEISGTSWYDSVVLYRQKELGGWKDVFVEIECDLKHLLSNTQTYD